MFAIILDEMYWIWCKECHNDERTRTLAFFKEIDDINELIWYNYLLMSYYQSTNQIYFCVDKK